MTPNLRKLVALMPMCRFTTGAYLAQAADDPKADDRLIRGLAMVYADMFAEDFGLGGDHWAVL